MTKEEAKKIIEYTFLNADGHLKPLDFDYWGGKGIVEALRMAIEALSQPPLPSNLDEAAEKFAHLYDNGTCDGIAQDCFKAGAEWMARKGVTKEAGIGIVTKKIIITVTQSTLEELDLCPGDKVVVQIRKK